MRICHLPLAALALLAGAAIGPGRLPAADAPSAAEAVEHAVADAVVETVKAAAEQAVQDKTLVLRISREFIRERVPRVVDQPTPIDRCLFGAHVTGTAITNGRPLVVEGHDPQRPSFTVQFSGTTVATTGASTGPVRACSTGRADYTVRRTIRFGPGGFRADPPSIDCQYASALDGLGLPPGLRGRVVKRFAMPTVEQTRPAADAIARADTQQAVLAAFTAKTDTLVHDLNRRMPWKETLALVAPNGKERVRRLTTTPVYVEIRSSVVDAAIPALPRESQDLRAPLELWVLGKPGPVVSAELMALWGLSRMALPSDSGPVTKALDRAAASGPVRAVVSGFEPELLGDWWVLRLGANLMERVLGKPAQAPRP